MSPTFHVAKTPFYCVGHPRSKRPCVFEPGAKILHAAKIAWQVGTITRADFDCIARDLGADFHPTARGKRTKEACLAAYKKIGRTICEACASLWVETAAGNPKLLEYHSPRSHRRRE